MHSKIEERCVIIENKIDQEVGQGLDALESNKRIVKNNLVEWRETTAKRDLLVDNRLNAIEKYLAQKSHNQGATFESALKSIESTNNNGMNNALSINCQDGQQQHSQLLCLRNTLIGGTANNQTNHSNNTGNNNNMNSNYNSNNEINFAQNAYPRMGLTKNNH